MSVSTCKSKADVLYNLIESHRPSLMDPKESKTYKSTKVSQTQTMV